MRAHLDLLALMHVIWGVFGVLTGAALALLAAGTALAAADLGTRGPAPGVVTALLLLTGGALGVLGAAVIAAGRAIRSRRAGGRQAALVLAGLHLLAVPFGTGLGLYTFWVLLHHEARAAFVPAAAGAP